MINGYLIAMGVSNFGKGSVMLILKSCWCSVVKILIRNNQVFYEQRANNTEKPIYQVAKPQSPIYNSCVVSVVNFLHSYVSWNLLLELWKQLLLELWKQSLVITLLVAAGGRHWYSAESKLIHLPLYFCWMIVSSAAGHPSDNSFCSYFCILSLLY